MCSSATLAGFFDLSDASGPPWALLDLLLLFLDVLLLLVLLLVALHLADGRADLPLHAVVFRRRLHQFTGLAAVCA